MDEELSIGALSERSGVAVSALRFYEERGLIFSTRTDGGQRRYKRDTLRRLGFIQAAQRVGLTLNEIGESFDSLPHKDSLTAREWKRLSASWRSLLDERIRILESLRSDLSGCIGCGCLSLQRCRLVNAGDRLGYEGPGPRRLLKQ